MDLESLRQKMLSEFECLQSGNCCRCPGVVYVTPQNIEAMSRELGITIIEFREQYVVKRNGWDVIADSSFRSDCFLDDQNRCRVYATRPTSCRSYPNWPEIWSSEDRLKQEIELCPGLRKVARRLKVFE